MARFELLGTATIPGKGTQLRLLQRNDEFSIRVAGISGELMNTCACTARRTHCNFSL